MLAALGEIENIPHSALPTEYRPWIAKDPEWDERWEQSEPQFKRTGFEHYNDLFVDRGYKLHFMPSNQAEMLAMPRIEPPKLKPVANPFRPKKNEMLRYAIKGTPLEVREFIQPRPNIIPAYDPLNREVMIKALPLDSQELEIWRYLNSPKLRADKRNRTIPLLDIFRSDDTVFVVMPEWTYVSSLPSCLNVREHLDDAVQYIEGLQFMHEHHIAHRDICGINLLGNHAFNYQPKVPEPFRSEFNFQIAFIDFEYAVYISPDAPTQLVVGKSIGNFQNAPPEVESDAPYDPFKSDVYAIGKELELILDSNDKAWPLLHQRTDTVLKAVEEHVPAYLTLLDQMTSKLPSDRPTIAGALVQLRFIRSTLPNNVLYKPIDTRPQKTDSATQRRWCIIM